MQPHRHRHAHSCIDLKKLFLGERFAHQDLIIFHLPRLRQNRVEEQGRLVKGGRDAPLVDDARAYAVLVPTLVLSSHMVILTK